MIGTATRIRTSSTRSLRSLLDCSRNDRRLISASSISFNKNQESYEWASKEAIEALEGFKARFTDSSNSMTTKPVSHYFQQVDPNQVHLLRITLASMVPLQSCQKEGIEDEEQLRKKEENILTSTSSSVLKNGIPFESSLIPTEHLAFFTPRVTSSSLGADGSDTDFNPPGGIFTRRMWAGGEMQWNLDSNLSQIKIGDRIWEKTFVEDVQLKRLGGGRGEMIVVWVRKEFGTMKDEENPTLIDRRSWVYQRALQSSSSSDKTPKDLDNNHSTIRITKPNLSSFQPPKDLLYPTLQWQNAANLFRYSAMTFNAHAIHLSPPWAQQVEGHQDIVVHGPLNLPLLVRKWGREIAGWKLNEKGEFVQGNKNIQLQSVKYRAKKPVYAHQPYWIGIAPSQTDGQHTVLAILHDGQVAMEATITSTASA